MSWDKELTWINTSRCQEWYIWELYLCKSYDWTSSETEPNIPLIKTEPESQIHPNLKWMENQQLNGCTIDYLVYGLLEPNVSVFKVSICPVHLWREKKEIVVVPWKKSFLPSRLKEMIRNFTCFLTLVSMSSIRGTCRSNSWITNCKFFVPLYHMKLHKNMQPSYLIHVMRQILQCIQSFWYNIQTLILHENQLHPFKNMQVCSTQPTTIIVQSMHLSTFYGC